MKIAIILTVLFVFTGCSSLSKNTIAKGDFSIKHGVWKNKVWKEKLNFQRISWYQELSLLFDLKIARISDKSPFYNWFSESTKSELKRCEDFYLAMIYELDNDKISKKLFLSKMKSKSYRQMIVKGFKSNLRMHPNYKLSALNQYKVVGLCKTQKTNSKLEITFPGFKTVQIDN
jgi:hypothetical protein